MLVATEKVSKPQDTRMGSFTGISNAAFSRPEISTTFMRVIITANLLFILFIGCPYQAYSQGCNSLQNAASSDLVSFLDAVRPDENNSWCAKWAIDQLGSRHYDPGAAALVRLLDFHRPLTANEKLGINLHPRARETSILPLTHWC
jgi:hypothetical protein